MKTLYIGIGGNGVKTLAAIKRKMESYVQFRTAGGETIRINDQFLFVDTDTNDILGIPGVDLDRDFVSLDMAPSTQFNNEKTQPSEDSNRFFDWYDPDKTKLSSASLSSGAGAIRMDGRLGLYANKTRFMNLVFSKLEALNQATGDPDLNNLPMCIYVFSGTSGGTGSGILLDVLMTIDKKYTEVIQDPHKAPSCMLFLFGPDQTYTIESDQVIKNKKACNGAACLCELDAFKRCTIKNPLGNHRIFNRFSGWVNNLELTSSFHFPKYVYYIDNTLVATGLTQTQTVSYTVMHDLAADFVFNLEVGKLNKFTELKRDSKTSGIGTLDSILVNGEQNLINVNGYCQMFNTFAPLSVCFPKELFSRYCSTRFNVECFNALRGNENASNVDEKKSTFKNTLDDKFGALKTNIKSIFDADKKSAKTVAAGISVDQTQHRIEYFNPDAPKFYQLMGPVVASAKKDIENWIYTHFADMLQTEGVGEVIDTVTQIDGMLSSLSTTLKDQVKTIPQQGFLQRDASYFEEVLECIYKLVEIEIYDYCSSGNDGVLDHVTAHLDALRTALRAKMQDCTRTQGEYIGTLNAENSNPLRQYLPRLDTIVRDNAFIAGNEFERKYSPVFTPDYIETVRKNISDDEQIKTDILEIVKSGDKDKAASVVVAMAKMVGNHFSNKFANDDTIIKYSNTAILDKLREQSAAGNTNYQKLITGHQGALFPTNSAVFNNHTHRRMILANFNNDSATKDTYLCDIPVDDAFFTDRVVSFYVTNGLSIDDITSLKVTYLSVLKNNMSTHPAFSDKRFDIAPFSEENTIYEAMAGGSVELSIDLLTLLMLCILDVRAGRTNLYKAGDVVKGTVTFNSKTCDYYYQIFNGRSMDIAFPTFFKDNFRVQMEEYKDSDDNTLADNARGNVYTQQQNATQETKDCYNYILKGTITSAELSNDSFLDRLRSMLKIRLNDNDVQYYEFTKLLSDARLNRNFEVSVIRDNISLL